MQHQSIPLYLKYLPVPISYGKNHLIPESQPPAEGSDHIPILYPVGNTSGMMKSMKQFSVF